MNKVYTRINWENYPSEKTAVNEANLNKMDSALNEIDTRVVQHETTKANVASLNNLIDDWVIDETTGVITIHKVSGEQIIFDLNIEKVPVGFSMTDDGILIMTTDDGTEFRANIGSMIPILTFNDSEQIAVAVSGEGVNKTYTFTIKTGSIGEDKLQPNFLADCRLYAGNAEESANSAKDYADQAKESAESISNKASDISFDDTNAQLGADNVQEAIESVVDKITDGAWIVVTDSYGTTYPEASGTKTFFDYMRELSGRDSSQLVGLAYSGCGFINNAGGFTFLEGFTSFTSTYESKEKVSKIIVAAGRNDYISTTDEVYNAELAFFNYCKEHYKNAEVVFAFISNGDNSSAGTRAQLLNVYNAYRKCTDFGAKYINGSEAILHNSDCMANDGIHPSIYGKQQIAKYLLEGISTGSCHVCYPIVKVPINCSNSNMTLVNHSCRQWVDDNVCYIEFDQVNQITFTNNYGMSPNNLYTQEIGEYTGTKYVTNPFDKIVMDIEASGYTEAWALNEKLHIMYFIDADGKLKVMLYNANSQVSTKYIVSLGSKIIAVPCVYC